jgi:hypothetical protein
MPLDPQAKRFLTMAAATPTQNRSRPSPEARRQAFARLMQFARADVAAVSGADGVMPGPAADLAYRRYTPSDITDERLPGFGGKNDHASGPTIGSEFPDKHLHKLDLKLNGPGGANQQ